VRQAFEANFAEGWELGARFALAIDGEIVIDLIGGWADRAWGHPLRRGHPDLCLLHHQRPWRP